MRFREKTFKTKKITLPLPFLRRCYSLVSSALSTPRSCICLKSTTSWVVEFFLVGFGFILLEVRGYSIKGNRRWRLLFHIVSFPIWKKLKPQPKKGMLPKCAMVIPGNKWHADTFFSPFLPQVNNFFHLFPYPETLFFQPITYTPNYWLHPNQNMQNEIDWVDGTSHINRRNCLF